MSKENSETPSPTSPAVTPWATLTLEPLAGGDAAAADGDDAAWVDAFDALGALLAELPAVGGVETRDPALIGATVERPELVVYLRPEDLEAVEPMALRYAQGMGLQVMAKGRVRDDDDWRDSWKQFYQPMVFGKGSLLLRPSWVERRADDPERELVIDPGRAFGTGLHESTRLCLEVSLARVKEGFAPRRVLDLGCGSGILGLAVARVTEPSPHLTFIDHDPEAVETSRENAELNGLESSATFETGEPDGFADQRFDLVFANIRPSVLIPHAEDIASRVDAGGELILSGILIEEGDEVAAAYEGRDLDLVDRPRMNDWCALHYRKATGSR